MAGCLTWAFFAHLQGLNPRGNRINIPPIEAAAFAAFLAAIRGIVLTFGYDILFTFRAVQK